MIYFYQQASPRGEKNKPQNREIKMLTMAVGYREGRSKLDNFMSICHRAHCQIKSIQNNADEMAAKSFVNQALNIL